MSELVTDPVRVRAHAKLTLSLRVLGRRDDGYHEIEALTASLGEPTDVVEVSLRGDGRFTLQVDGEVAGVPSDGSNLAVEAVRQVTKRVEPGAGALVRLTKAIPVGAGLGGGSADAAAALVALTRLLPAETDGLDLAAIGAGLGSDVPFCVRGGLAWMRGRGEVVEPVAGDPPALGVVVAVPPRPLATPDVYARWDDLGGPVSERRLAVPAALEPLVGERVNDLEPAALELAPDLADFRDRVEAAAGAPALLAGSGSSYALLFDEVGDAREAAAALEAAVPEAAVFATTLVPEGVTV